MPRAAARARERSVSRAERVPETCQAGPALSLPRSAKQAAAREAARRDAGAWPVLPVLGPCGSDLGRAMQRRPGGGPADLRPGRA
jgi:hypothetical protein